MECKFVVGQKVTPIKETRWSFPTNYGPILCSGQPAMGEVYTVTGFDDRFKTLGIYLEEFPPVSLPDDHFEPGYAANLFRAVDDSELKAADELLKKIMNTNRARV